MSEVRVILQEPLKLRTRKTLWTSSPGERVQQMEGPHQSTEVSYPLWKKQVQNLVTMRDLLEPLIVRMLFQTLFATMTGAIHKWRLQINGRGV